MILCEYGCGKEAKYQLKNGKWCCSKSHNSCSKIREKNSFYMKKAHINNNNFERYYEKESCKKGKTYEEMYGKEKAKKFKDKLSKSLKDNVWKNKHLPNEMKIKISESMKKAHKEGRAWNIGRSRWNNKESYPEKFFKKVIQNEFYDKNYKYEYSVSIYSIDFAWPHKLKAIEIDGEQHERFAEYRERDKRKDSCLIEKGWEVLRIKWKDLFENPQRYIKNANEFIGIIPL